MTGGGFEVVRAIIDDNEQERQDETTRFFAEATADRLSLEARREGISGNLWRACH